jgi:hypothetical protein
VKVSILSKITKVIFITVTSLLVCKNTYSQETQLICSFNSECKNKTYDECKKNYYLKNKKTQKGITDITDNVIEQDWLKLTNTYQIFDDKLRSVSDLSTLILDKVKVNTEKYYIFSRTISFDNQARFQIIVFDRNELIQLLHNFETTFSSADSINWPEKINTEKKLLDYVNYMFIKYYNPSYDNEKYVYTSSSICKIIENINPKF